MAAIFRKQQAKQRGFRAPKQQCSSLFGWREQNVMWIQVLSLTFFCWAAGECFENGESKLSVDFEILFSKRSTLSLNTSFLETWDFHTIPLFLPMTRSTLRPGNDVSTEN